MKYRRLKFNMLNGAALSNRVFKREKLRRQTDTFPSRIYTILRCDNDRKGDCGLGQTCFLSAFLFTAAARFSHLQPLSSHPTPSSLFRDTFSWPPLPPTAFSRRHSKPLLLTLHQSLTQQWRIDWKLNNLVNVSFSEINPFYISSSNRFSTESLQ